MLLYNKEQMSPICSSKMLPTIEFENTEEEGDHKQTEDKRPRGLILLFHKL